MSEEPKQFIEPVESIEADQARAFMDEADQGTFTLLDVRQPKEYDRGHISGAKLIPLPELADAYEQLDSEKPVMVYCALGGRSRAAAQLLAGKGFKKIYNLNGGIKAWEGPVAEGPVELNLNLIRGDETPVEIIQLAYGMEMSLGGFYTTMTGRAGDPQVVALLRNLASIEDKHKQYLRELYKSVQGTEMNVGAFEAEVSSKILEGGFGSEEFMKRNENFIQTVPGLLDISMMLETQALDLYLRFSQKVRDEHTREILFKIAYEEKAHLKALGRLREEKT